MHVWHVWIANHFIHFHSFLFGINITFFNYKEKNLKLYFHCRIHQNNHKDSNFFGIFCVCHLKISNHDCGHKHIFDKKTKENKCLLSDTDTIFWKFTNTTDILWHVGDISLRLKGPIYFLHCDNELNWRLILNKIFLAVSYGFSSLHNNISF